MTISPYQAFGYQKPPYGTKVDRSHPLAKNLTVAAMLNEGTGSKIRNEGYAEIAGVILNAAAPWNALTGWANPTHLDFDGSNDVIDFGARSRTAVNYGDSAVGMTWCALVYSRTGGTFLCKRDGGTTEFQVFDQSTAINWLTAGSSGVIISAAQGWGLNEWNLIAGSADAAGVCQGYINGSPAGSASVGAPTRRDVNLAIGARWNVYPTTALRWAGGIAFVYIWTGRLLSAEEHAQLALDPYQMFEDRSRDHGFLPHSVAAPGGLPIPVAMHEYRQRHQSIV